MSPIPQALVRAPMPWLGGKSRCAAEVWDALGDVHHYIEPFAGSLAVALNRPETHTHSLTTVNDKDANLANFWRALHLAPDEVAHHADWPVSEIDTRARHRWLVETLPERRAKLEADPEYFDAKAAGWWVWGTSCSIVPGLFGAPKEAGGTSGTTDLNRPGRGAHERMHSAPRCPTMDLAGGPGKDVREVRGPGLPHLSSPGQGVNQLSLAAEPPTARPCLARPRGTNRDGVSGGGLPPYFAELSRRLRRVRVCCGDWSRVVSDGVLNYGGSVGILLDPPYSDDVRTSGIYGVDSDPNIAVAVRKWAISKGDDPRLRIALCGYEQEHVAEMPSSWRMLVVERVATPYASTAKQEERKERLWLSPHCLVAKKPQRSLFA